MQYNNVSSLPIYQIHVPYPALDVYYFQHYYTIHTDNNFSSVHKLLRNGMLALR